MGQKGRMSIMPRRGECHSHSINVLRAAEMETTVIKEKVDGYE
jgi:hypothetical protein